MAIAIGLAIRLALMFGLLAVVPPSTSDAPFAGVFYALVGSAFGMLLGFAAAVIAVPVGLRGRAGGNRFAWIFAGVLLAIHVAQIVVLGLAALWIPFRLEYDAAISGLIFAPLLFTVPAAVTRLIRWRTAALVAGSGIAAVLVITAALAVQSGQEQSGYNADYTGPVYLPSTSPESPLERFVLRGVELPGPYQDWEGASQIELSYIRPGGTGESGDDRFYRLQFSEDTAGLLCGGDFSPCPEIGRALGSPILSNSGSGEYYLEADGGLITLAGYIDADEAVRVYQDLVPGQIGDYAGLSQIDE